MRRSLTIGTYAYYTSALFLITGILILIFDVKRFDEKAKKNMIQKGSRSLGWINVCLGVVLFFGYWIYNKWFWM
jgi:uncharacterized membrane protein